MPDQDEYQVIDTQEPDGETLELAVEPPAVPKPEPAEETAHAEPVVPEPETPEQIEEKRKTGSARAKAKLVEEREKNRQLLERIERLEAKGGPTPNPQSASSDEPKLEDFETFEAYNKAAIRFEALKIVQENKAHEQAAKAAQSWEAKKDAARAELPDFDDVLADMLTPAPVVVAVMNASEHTAKIAYHLAQNPEELQKINQMSPPEAALAIGEIAALVKAPPKPKPTTKAPPPMRPTPGGTVAPQEDAGYVIY